MPAGDDARRADLYFDVGPATIRETAYGIVRRFRFFVDELDSLATRLGRRNQDLRILDIGAGTGVHVAAPLARAGFNVVALDAHGPSVERGLEIFGESPRLSFVHAALEDFQGGPFDAAIASEVLEHCGDPSAFLTRVRRTLTPNGLALITVPNGRGVFELSRWLEERLPRLLPKTDSWQRRWVRRLASPHVIARHDREWLPEVFQLSWSSLDPEQGHAAHFSQASLIAAAGQAGLALRRWKNRTVLASNVVSNVVRDWDRFLVWNGRAADRLPARLCSGWMASFDLMPTR